MTMVPTQELTVVEEQLLQIARTLPPARIAQLIDFANFLAQQSRVAEGSNGNEAWDEQIEQDFATGRLGALLAEVDQEYEAGLARPL
jgi:hypothetical protein